LRSTLEVSLKSVFICSTNQPNTCSMRLYWVEIRGVRRQVDDPCSLAQDEADNPVGMM
jgi:hypothetical protein